MKPFNLTPASSYSENDFKKSMPDPTLYKDKIIKDLLENGSETCCGCGYTTGKKESLQEHLNWWDGVNHDTAEFVLICEACHALKHFDKAIEKNWVVLVNSTYSQEDLIKRNRSSAAIKKDLDEHKIVLLKKTPKEYFDEITESLSNRNPKTKILFGNKFNWVK